MVKQGENDMATELKPCPFCGGEAFCRVTDEGIEDEHLLFYVECDDCYISTPYSYDRERSIEAWNRRAEDGESLVCNP